MPTSKVELMIKSYILIFLISFITKSLSQNDSIEKSNSDYDVEYFKDSENSEDEKLNLIVFVDFVVDKKGNITQVKATKCMFCDGYDSTSFMREAERVVATAPKWDPPKDRYGRFR
jgi:hypothetical protein